ncbi:MAG: hypothetical protein HZA28_04360 [Candidatus Omnitrophica bacterium]|nr:hypothetical protein [Candidatus Omnitrophota bacterium]
MSRTSNTPNNAINADSKKRCAFVAPLFTAGYGERYISLASTVATQKLENEDVG